MPDYETIDVEGNYIDISGNNLSFSTPTANLSFHRKRDNKIDEDNENTHTNPSESYTISYQQQLFTIVIPVRYY